MKFLKSHFDLSLPFASEDKMECTKINVEGDREEGEIFDDDLETISDDSIAPSPTTGKLNSTEESLRALSLSSVSDLEVVECLTSSDSNHKHRRRGRAKKRRKLHKRYYARSSSGSSLENEETRKTKKLLKEAIKRDTEEIHNKSLRTRLKNMVQKTTLSEDTESNNLQNGENLKDEPPVSDPISIEVESKETNESPTREESVFLDGDTELIQLRLEALKTAVVNKFQRKRRKVKVAEQDESKTLETNKENSPDNVNTRIFNVEDQNCPAEITERDQVNVNNSSPNSAINSEEEVDEDILRAVLLASMAKKMTDKVPIPKKKNANSSNNIMKKQSKPPQVVAKTIIDPPKIKPFIISINNPDSDSNDEFNDIEETKNNKVIKEKELELKIDKFLKQQRAEVEAKTNSPTASRTTPSTKLSPKQNIEMNNLYKLLPKKKQLEYEMLIQTLKSREKKPKLKRLSVRTLDQKITKVPRIKTINRTVESNSVPNNISKSGLLQRQLKQVQQQVSGRLQKDKYQELSSLMKRLNEANEEQKKHEIRIKSLLGQLKDARIQSARSQQVFGDLMKEFLSKKAEIDSNAKEVSSSQRKAEFTNKPPTATTKNITSQKVVKPTEPKEKTVNIRNNSVQCKIVLEKCPANLEDPNDIEFKTMPKMGNGAVPKYSSPLDYMESKSNKIHNPMEILCPFEMDGVCRDKDCVYNHCN